MLKCIGIDRHVMVYAFDPFFKFPVRKSVNLIAPQTLYTFNSFIFLLLKTVNFQVIHLKFQGKSVLFKPNNFHFIAFSSVDPNKQNGYLFCVENAKKKQK